MRVEDVMTRAVITCAPDDTLERAAQLLWERGCGVLPVVDGAGALVGMLTDRDALMGAYTQGQPLREVEVARAMTRVVVTCTPAASLDRALAQMSERRIHRLPVLDETGRLVGLLSLDDVAYASCQHRAHGPAAQSVAEALAAIAGHRGPARGAQRPHAAPTR